ncbi:hypothetical protein [Amycolatopsis vancoresmycina]|uniref:Uncharacterized protein n=1 Tax=Amycolatopsis vancoresmycina DSM 44592 TaxID=1292037 RepID=R1GG53_9PSEU|nr:hypothetical protein [Amycolatopsis vancoresmycina]EOD70257.1 hypothetical protein H480_01934 [Amycolatopsis vancoresmycina DSM 44592]
MTAFRWDTSSRAVLGDALVRLGPNRCVAEVRPDEVVLTEPLSRRDRAGTTALLECGAALSTIWTVVRVLGRDPIFVFPHDADRPAVAAVVRTGGPRPPSSGEWARYVALRKLGEPELRPVSLAVLSALADDGFWPETEVRIVRPAWVPALEQLGADVTGQSALLVTTPDDSRRHHVLAGAALHGTRLAAAVRGFSSRTVRLPHLTALERTRQSEVLPGIPQGLLLIGLTRRKAR